MKMLPLARAILCVASPCEICGYPICRSTDHSFPPSRLIVDDSGSDCTNTSNVRPSGMPGGTSAYTNTTAWRRSASTSRGVMPARGPVVLARPTWFFDIRSIR
jgi:hypothetical protein